MKKKKIKLMLDITILFSYLDKNSCRSGILFVALNILREFVKNENFEIILYCDYRRFHYIEPVILALKEEKIIQQDFKLISNNIIANPYISFMARYKYLMRKNHGKDNIIKKIIRYVAFRSLKAHEKLLKIYDKYYQQYKPKSKNFCKSIKEIDAYFSPYYKIPDEIKANNIPNFLYLYDAIPIVMKELYDKINTQFDEFDEMFNSLTSDSFYFSISECTKKDYVKLSNAIEPDNVCVVPLAANENFAVVCDDNKIKNIKQKYNIPADKKFIFSLCTLEPRKNLIFAVKNFIEFIKKNNIDDFVFVLGGASWKKFLPLLEKEISDFKEYRDKILKIGYVEDEDLSTLYSASEMFVYPSLYEGFGLPILEAMQCGTPVICSNTSSMPEVIGDCGIMINPTDDNELIEAYEKMYFNRDFRNQCIKKGLERAKTFSWGKCANTIANIIIDKYQESQNTNETII